MVSFKNPLGDDVERDESEISSFNGVDAHKAIDKGDGSFLTSGYPKDAKWTAERIAEGDALGLNTTGWWDAEPSVIQGKIWAAERAASAPVRTGPTPAEQ